MNPLRPMHSNRGYRWPRQLAVRWCIAKGERQTWPVPRRTAPPQLTGALKGPN